MVRQQVESNSRRAAKSRRKIDDKKLEKIREYLLRSVHHPIYVEDVKRVVWNHASIMKPPTNQTIAKAMKNELKMSYRTLSTRHPKTFSSDSKRLFLEAAIVQITLCNCSFLYPLRLPCRGRGYRKLKLSYTPSPLQNKNFMLNKNLLKIIKN